MAEREIDEYLAGLEEPKRSTLEALRRDILEVVPDAEQCIAYRMPAFRVQGKVVAGLAAFTKHLSYIPHSGSVIAEVSEARGYDGTQGTLHFPVDQPLPKALVRKLIEVRMRLLGIG